jgi:hypothetical protein
MWIGAGNRLRVLACGACLAAAPLLALAATPTSQPAAKSAEVAGRLAGPRTQPAGDNQARPRNRRPAPSGDRPQPPPLTDEQIEQVLTFTREAFPNMYERLAAVRERNPQTFRRSINRVAKLVMPMIEMKMRDPAIAEKMIAEHRTQMQIEQVTARYKAADTPQEKERLRARLRELMSRRFDLRMDRLRAEIRNLENRLNAAKQQLKSQETQKDAYIRDRLSELEG